MPTLSGAALALFALLAALCGCGSQAARAARGTWYELRTARFVVWTDGELDSARKLVLDLERFHQVVRGLTGAEERDVAPPLRIFMAKDSKSLHALIGRQPAIAGMMTVTTRGNYALIDASGLEAADADPYKMSSRATLFHEYTHFLQAERGARIPSWYNEGFAEYMSTTTFRDDGRYTLGCVPKYRLVWMSQLEWLPMTKVLASQNIAELEGSRGTHRTGSHLGPSRNPADAYAQSWLAVHFLLTDREHKLQLSKYLALWADGVAPAEAVQRAFGMSTDGFDRLLQGYAAKSEFDCVAVAPEERFTAPDLEVTPLSTGAAHYHVGDLLLSIQGPTDEALEVLERAAQLQPNDPATLRALARAHWLRAELAEAADQRSAELATSERYLQQALQRESAAAEASLLAGHLHRVKAALAKRAKQPYADELAAARTAYRSAIHSDDALAEAYVGLGATYLIEDNGSKEAQVVLEAATYLLPLQTETAMTLAKVQLARGHAAEAVPALEYVLRWSSDEEQRAEASSALAAQRPNADSP